MHLVVGIHYSEVWVPHHAFDEGPGVRNLIPSLRSARKVDHPNGTTVRPRQDVVKDWLESRSGTALKNLQETGGIGAPKT